MNCPICNKTIFHLKKEAQGVFQKSTKDPSMYHKDGKYHVDCPSCKKPVLLEETTSETTVYGVGVVFRLPRSFVSPV